MPFAQNRPNPAFLPGLKPPPQFLGPPIGPPGIGFGRGQRFDPGATGIPTDGSFNTVQFRGGQPIPLRPPPGIPGGGPSQPPFTGGNPRGYAHGSRRVPGHFIGRDSVPALLEPGEAILNRKAASQPGVRAAVAYANRLGSKGGRAMPHMATLPGQPRHYAGGSSGVNPGDIAGAAQALGMQGGIDFPAASGPGSNPFFPPTLPVGGPQVQTSPGQPPVGFGDIVPPPDLPPIDPSVGTGGGTDPISSRDDPFNRTPAPPSLQLGGVSSGGGDGYQPGWRSPVKVGPQFSGGGAGPGWAGMYSPGKPGGSLPQGLFTGTSLGAQTGGSMPFIGGPDLNAPGRIAVGEGGSIGGSDSDAGIPEDTTAPSITYTPAQLAQAQASMTSGIWSPATSPFWQKRARWSSSMGSTGPGQPGGRRGKYVVPLFSSSPPPVRTHG